MIESKVTKRLSPLSKSLIVISILIVLGIIIGYIFSQYSLQIITNEIEKLPIQVDQSRISRSIDYYIGAIIILTIELILLVGLLYIYYDSYRKTKSRFIIVLNFFILALLVKSALSIFSLHYLALDYIRFIPYISRTFLTPGFGIFNFIITGIEILAMCILVYISME